MFAFSVTRVPLRACLEIQDAALESDLFAREMREKTRKLRQKEFNCFHFAPVERANLLFSKQTLTDFCF
jgi:hypothetical protein